MPRVSYPLELGGPERLQITWSGSFKDGAVLLDGSLVGEFADAKSLKSGKSFSLPDGSRLSVKLGKNFLGIPEIELTLNGDKLRTDPRKRLGAAWGVIVAVGVLNVLVGMIGEAFSVGFLAQMGVGWGSMLFGLLYIGMGILVRRGSRAALGFAVALFALDGIATLALSAKASGAPPVGGLVMRVFLLAPMIGGFSALGDLDRAKRRPRRRAVPPRPAGTPSPRPARPAPPVAVREQERKVREIRVEPPPSPRSVRMEVRPTKNWGTDVAAESLRGVAHRCELGDEGMKVGYRDLKQREVTWQELTGIWIRQLPMDPPWEGHLVLDVGLSGAPPLVRILPATFVNFGALPGGASSARLENVRKLASYLAAKRPDLALDEETKTFVSGGKVPERFPTLAAFVDYDARFG